MKQIKHFPKQDVNISFWCVSKKIFIKLLHCVKPEIPNVCMFMVFTEYVCCNLEMKRSGESFIIYGLNGSQSYINLILIGFEIKLYNA